MGPGQVQAGESSRSLGGMGWWGGERPPPYAGCRLVQCRVGSLTRMARHWIVVEQ